MRRFLLSTAVVLYLSVPAAIAAARYGEWLLEQPRSSVLTLTFKQSASLNNKVATSETHFFETMKHPCFGADIGTASASEITLLIRNNFLSNGFAGQ
jgi:hypothetical protein